MKQNKEMNKRQKEILLKIEFGKEYTLNSIGVLLSENQRPALSTLRRDVSELYKLGFLTQTGERKGTKYSLTFFGIIRAPINAHEYCAVDVDNRNGRKNFNFSLFENFSGDLLSNEEKVLLENSTDVFSQKSRGASEIIKKKELERFVIELSWKSSKIEGNTYTLLDTEMLLKEGIEASGHTKKEAIMILNHKKAFQYIFETKEKHKKISVRSAEDIHRLIVEGLDVSFGLRSKPVGIIGSKYLPLSVLSQIQEALAELCSAIERMKNPYAKALLALVGISYIQPFEDGNKRTARLMANAILLAHGYAPLSYRNVDEVRYRESILVFYEKNSIIPMLKIFTEQYIFACENYLKF